MDNRETRLMCAMPACGKSFLRQSDLTRHIKEQHTPDEEKVKYFCGCCPPNSIGFEKGFERWPKLKSHKNKIHAIKEGSELLECEDKTCQGPKGKWKLYFCSKYALQRHIAEKHTDPLSTITPQRSPRRNAEHSTCKAHSTPNTSS